MWSIGYVAVMQGLHRDCVGYIHIYVYVGFRVFFVAFQRLEMEYMGFRWRIK